MGIEERIPELERRRKGKRNNLRKKGMKRKKRSRQNDTIISIYTPRILSEHHFIAIDAQGKKREK